MILVGLVALTIAVAGVRSGVVPGRAVAFPVPGPPVVGDCLLENPHPPGVNPYDLGWSVSVPLPSMDTGGCSGARYGEVVSVDAGVDVGSGGLDEAWPLCIDAAYGHLGVPNPAFPGEGHMTVANVWVQLIGPGDVQLAAGHDWSACVVSLPPADIGNGPGTVDHTLRDAWHHPEYGGMFAMCRLSFDPWEFTSCDQPHAYEMVSFWPGDPAVSDESNRDACRRDAIEWLGSPASLDRNELTVVVEYTRWDDVVNDVRIVEPAEMATVGVYDVECMLAPADNSRPLTGPVRGLGDAPAPLG